MTKRCYVCGLDKPPDAFTRNRSKRDGLSTECRDCNKKRLRARGWKGRPSRAAYERRWKYCLTTEEYERILAGRGGGCAICGAPPDRWPLVVDHDHQTGAIRGLLCNKCNTGIGKLGDSVEGLKQAIAYLERGSVHGGCGDHAEDPSSY